MLRVIRQLWVFSRFISEIQSSPAAPGYRQSRHKRKNSRTPWRTPAHKNAGKETTGMRGTLLVATFGSPPANLHDALNIKSLTSDSTNEDRRSTLSTRL